MAFKLKVGSVFSVLLELIIRCHRDGHRWLIVIATKFDSFTEAGSTTGCESLLRFISHTKHLITEFKDGGSDW